MKRLLIDISHVLKACMYASKGEKTIYIDNVAIPFYDEVFEIFLASAKKTLKNLNMTPSQCIIVKDGVGCKNFRRRFLPTYCEGRDKKPEEWYQAYKRALDKVEEVFLDYGAISVEKDGIEADDIIAALASKLDCIIWSGDKDMLAAGDVYYDEKINEDKFLGIAKEHIVVYKSLVGDVSDKIPGCRGYGEKAFLAMIEEFDYDSLDDMLEMLETETLYKLSDYVDQFKPFQKILDNEETVYASYQCAKFHHPGYTGLKWKQSYPTGSGNYFNDIKYEQELVTGSALDINKLKKELSKSKYVALDIETYMTEEGLAWSEANKKSGKKAGPLDIYGSVLAGFSFTAGVNGEKSYYFPVDHKDTDNLTFEQVREVLNLLPDDSKVPILVHNSSFELPVLRKYVELKFDRGYLPPNTLDTRIMASFVNENEPQGLKARAASVLGYKQQTYEEVLGDKSSMKELTGKEVVSYGIDDVIVTGALYSHFEVIMSYEETMYSYMTCDQKAQFMYAESFLNGIKIDIDVVKGLQKDNDKKYEELSAKISEFLSTPIIEERIASYSDIYGKITPDKLDDVRAFNESQRCEDPKMVSEIKYWPGSQYEPITDSNKASILKAIKIVTGEDITYTVRVKSKVLAIIAEYDQNLAGFFQIEDYDGLNEYLKKFWKPSPELNLRSPKQLTTLLYEHMGFPVRVRNDITPKQFAEGKTEGNPASNSTAISCAIAYDANESQKEFLNTIIEAKSCLTEDSLFYTPYQKLPHWEDGLVHANPGQSMATTGRSNSFNPNLSQISRKSLIRKAIKPIVDDFVFVSMDFSSQEIYLSAFASGDEAMLSCFGDERKDLHSLTGVEIYNIDDGPISYDDFVRILKDETHPKHEKVKKIRKGPAKTIGFASLYGAGAVKIAETLTIPVEQAQEMLDAKNRAFPRVEEWKKECEDLHRERGYATTMLGRRKHINLNASPKEIGHELRSASNSIIQGSAAEMTKKVLSDFWESKIFERYTGQLLATIHDEVLMGVAREHVVDFIKEAHSIMTQNYAGLPINIKSSIDVGINYYDRLEIGEEPSEDLILEALEEYAYEKRW